MTLRRHTHRYGIRAVYAAIALLAMIAQGCSSVKHVPDGEYLLDRVSITVDDSTDVDSRELRNFLRQQPNHKVLGFAKLRLATYNLSGSDTTRWYNRWLQRVGSPPVIYDSTLTRASERQLRQAMVNKGYTHASVHTDTLSDGKKMRLTYHINGGTPHRVASVSYDIQDSALMPVIDRYITVATVQPGMLLDRTALDNERSVITKRLRDRGFYDFNREYISYRADTIAGSPDVALTLTIAAPKNPAPSTNKVNIGTTAHHSRYIVRRVIYVLNEGEPDGTPSDTVRYQDISIVYGSDRYLKPQILDDMCYIKAGRPYSARDVERTYEALGRLSILKYINIEFRRAGTMGDLGMTDAYIMLARTKTQSASVELEGTNSEGDLGVGLGLTYQHRNLSRGSDLLTAKLRGSYESLSGDFEGLINNRYTEVAAEVGITFPKFECPFLTKAFKQRWIASSEFSVSSNYQERPEYTRVIFGAGWRWKWQRSRLGYLQRQRIDLIDINFVRLPRSTIDFMDQVAPNNPLLRYSYEDHFIMRTGYTYQRTNRRTPTDNLEAHRVQPYVSSLRASVETAGNLLYGLSHLVHQTKHEGVYKVFGAQYAQYVKGEFDYTFTRNFTARTSLAAHGGFGIAYPYGNSSMVPFEKRFYAGGANGVRGWGVRTLGPGRYDSRNSVTDFINQCGDIRLELSVEFRQKLFWVLEGAVFVDAGNIWTVHDYENQPGGMFRFDSFYKELAWAYGVGLRLDFTYFLLRLDMGLKAYNPAMNQEHWPLLHFNWKHDANIHFSVGYPF